MESRAVAKPKDGVDMNEKLEEKIFDLLGGYPKHDCLTALLCVASALATNMADGHPTAAAELFKMAAQAISDGPPTGPLN
jgi:hypothetical protein